MEAFQPLIPGMIAEQLAALAGPQPAVPVGTQCWMIERGCPFWERCFPIDEHHVWTLYRAYKTQKWGLVLKGIRRVLDLPDDYKLSEIQRRQRAALETGRMIVEPGLREALCEFDCRLGFLDFETIGRAIPVWPDVGPWRQVVVQFSYHEQSAGAPRGYRHSAYLAEGPGDPREELALRLLEATRDAERIVMYSSLRADPDQGAGGVGAAPGPRSHGAPGEAGGPASGHPAPRLPPALRGELQHQAGAQSPWSPT